MTSIRLDLRRLRLLLAAVAVMLALIAAAPHGASAQGTGQSRCGDAGGTWTTSTDGNTGTCKGLGRNKDYKCHLDVGPNACEYLAIIVGGTPRGPRVVNVESAGVSEVRKSTPVPTYVAVEASTDASVMSPLDE